MAHMDLLAILGGPMSVSDREILSFMEDEIRLIETALETAVPVLGICLGAQIIASPHPLHEMEAALVCRPCLADMK